MTMSKHLAEPVGHGRRQSRLHLHVDQRIIGNKARKQRRHEQRAVIVHHAEANAPLDILLAHPPDRFLVQAEDAPRIAEQPLTGRTQIDIRFGAVKQLGLQPFLEPLHLHAHGRLRAVQRHGRAGKGAMLRHRDEGLQQIRVQGRSLITKCDYKDQYKFHSLISAVSLTCQAPTPD